MLSQLASGRESVHLYKRAKEVTRLFISWAKFENMEDTPGESHHEPDEGIFPQHHFCFHLPQRLPGRITVRARRAAILAVRLERSGKRKKDMGKGLLRLPRRVTE